MNRSKADLYLLPSLIADAPLEANIPEGALEAVRNIRHFICETPKSARRSLKKMGLVHPLQELSFYPLNKHTDPEDIPSYLTPCLEGYDSALISDAGCPGVADPGAELIALAHAKGVRVRPLPGPSSIFMTLMASGMNGQRFRFHGYAPHEDKELKKLLERMEQDARDGETQLIMETPYRNDRLFDAFLKRADPDLRLCIAIDLTAKTESVRTLPLQEWDAERPKLHKRPAVFALGK